MVEKKEKQPLAMVTEAKKPVEDLEEVEVLRICITELGDVNVHCKDKHNIIMNLGYLTYARFILLSSLKVDS